jgi:uncharacterized membrane protein
VIDVQTEVEIDRPIDAVAGFAADPDNVTRWYSNIETVTWQTPPPASIGSRMTFVARFLGRRLEYTYEIVELEPARRLVMSTSQGPFPMETTYTWESLGADRTRMALRNRGEPSGFSKAVAPFMVRAVRRANEKDLGRLKSVLESDGANEGV